MSPTAETAVDLTPNVGSEASDFFQTDAALQRQQEHEAKLEKFRNAGDPVKTPSKVLNMVSLPSSLLTDFDLGISAPFWILTAESGFVSRLCNGKTGKCVKTLRGHRGPVTCVQWFIVKDQSKDSETVGKGKLMVATGSWDKTVRLWDLQTGECVRVLEGHADFVKCLAVHHYPQGHPFDSAATNKTLLFSGSSDSSVRVWDIETGLQVAKLDGHRRAVESLAVDATGETLYTASSDTTIRQFNLRTQECVAVFEGHQTSVVDLHLLEDEEALWSASADCTVRRWDLKTKQSDTVLKHKDWVGTITLCGSSYLMSGGREEKVRVWDLQTEKVKHVFEGHCDEVSSLLVVGSTLVSASYDCTIRQWDLKSALSKTQKKSEQEHPVQEISAAENLKPEIELTAEEEAELAELMDE